MSTHDPLVSLDDIDRNLRLLLEFTAGTNYERFRKDIKLQYAVIRCFEVIGEAARRVPDEFRSVHPGFPWKTMAAMRDKLVHGYDVVDSSIVWATIVADVVPALRSIEAIRQQDH
jgi:uncharacterized protein with HEPN domain